MRFITVILLLITCSSFTDTVHAGGSHVILSGGPALRKWEDLRIKRDQHDRWWANFIRAATIHMDKVRSTNEDSKIVWMVYRKAYESRGREDGKPYIKWIQEQASKRNASLVWVNSGDDVIRILNSQPRQSILRFDFFGHSNKHCFLLDYSAEIIGSSKAWLHQDELGAIKGSVFANNAHCQSWGCHTGESMHTFWKKATGHTLIGAKGKTDYTVVGKGIMPTVSGQWVR